MEDLVWRTPNIVSILANLLINSFQAYQIFKSWQINSRHNDSRLGTVLHILYASVLFLNIFFQLILNLVPILYFMILIANFGTVLQLKFMCTYFIPTTQAAVLAKRKLLF